MRITSTQEFINAEPIDRVHFIKRHFRSMTNASNRFSPTLGAFSRAINGDKSLAKLLKRIAESKTFQEKYGREKQRTNEQELAQLRETPQADQYDYE